MKNGNQKPKRERKRRAKKRRIRFWIEKQWYFFFISTSSTFGRKRLSRARFLQHYYQKYRYIIYATYIVRQSKCVPAVVLVYWVYLYIIAWVRIVNIFIIHVSGAPLTQPPLQVMLSGEIVNILTVLCWKCFLSAMKLTTDEFLEKIGSFGRYQIAINIFFNMCYALWWAIPVMISVFIASDPGWKCKNNSTCPFTETISLGDKRYSHRCDIPREDWEFNGDFTSIVTEVNLYRIPTLSNR